MDSYSNGPYSSKGDSPIKKLSNHARSASRTMEGQGTESSKYALVITKPQNFPWYDEEKELNIQMLYVFYLTGNYVRRKENILHLFSDQQLSF